MIEININVHHASLDVKHQLAQLFKLGEEIMSAISDFAAKQNAFNDRQGKAIDAAVQSIAGLSGDLQTLNAKITELQNSSGSVTPEDQALIDQLQTAGEATAAKVEALSTALSGLDALTPPAPPTAYDL